MDGWSFPKQRSWTQRPDEIHVSRSASLSVASDPFHSSTVTKATAGASTIVVAFRSRVEVWIHSHSAAPAPVGFSARKGGMQHARASTRAVSTSDGGPRPVAGGLEGAVRITSPTLRNVLGGFVIAMGISLVSVELSAFSCSKSIQCGPGTPLEGQEVGCGCDGPGSCTLSGGRPRCACDEFEVVVCDCENGCPS